MSHGLALRTDPVVVALAFDSSYIAPASAVIRSCLLRHDGGELRFEVIHDGSVSNDHLRRLEGMCLEHGSEISFHRMDDHLVGGLPLIGRFGPIVWSRLCFPPEASSAMSQGCCISTATSLCWTASVPFGRPSWGRPWSRRWQTSLSPQPASMSLASASITPEGSSTAASCCSTWTT